MARTPRSPKVRIEITEEIIAHATARDSQHCMIADAIRQAVPDAKSIAVDLATIRFTDPNKRLRYTYLTPRVAQVELVKFDQGMKSEPFSFQLRGAHVTRSGSSASRRAATPAQAEAAEKARLTMRRSKLTKSEHDDAAGNVAERVGGRTPPLQKSKDSVPFTRRRAFGLRGLDL